MLYQIRQMTEQLNALTEDGIRATTDAKLHKVLRQHLKDSDLPLVIQEEIFCQADISVTNQDLDDEDMQVLDDYLKAAVRALSLAFNVLKADYSEDIALKSLKSKAASFHLKID